MVVVVGGHSRNIGKTSVAAGLIRALPEARWTAVKITQYGHGVCPTAGEPCDCAVEYDHPYALTEESNQTAGTDTSRFLAAGAERALWLRTATGQLAEALTPLRRLIDSTIADGGNILIESNSILRFIKPSIYLMVLDFSVVDFKPSSLQALDRADAVITVSHGLRSPVWQGVSPHLWEDKLRFAAQPPDYCPAELPGFVMGSRR